MTTTYLANALSLQMLPDLPGKLVLLPMSLAQAQAIARGAESRVGHASTAVLFGHILGLTVAMNRVAVTLQPGDRLLVGQFIGARLPEGATELPPGAALRWTLVTWHPEDEVGNAG